MPKRSSQIDSPTNSKRQSRRRIQRLRRSGAPLLPTVKGWTEVVEQDAAAYQRLVEQVAQSESYAALIAIREGLADVAAGRTRPGLPALRSLARKHGLKALK